MADPYGWKKRPDLPIGQLWKNQLNANERYAIDMYPRAGSVAKQSPAYNDIAQKTRNSLVAGGKIGFKPNTPGRLVPETVAAPGSYNEYQMKKNHDYAFYSDSPKPHIYYRFDAPPSTVPHERTHAMQHMYGNPVKDNDFLKSVLPDLYYWYMDPGENDARHTVNMISQAFGDAEWLNSTISPKSVKLDDILSLLK